MKRTATRLTRVAMTSLAVLLVAPAPSFSQDAELSGDGYQAGTYGRVRYEENGATIRRAAVEQDAPPVDSGGLNSPIFPGDTLLTDLDQRVEIELSGGSLVRVDRDVELTFLALPDPYAQVADNIVFQLAQGTIRIAAEVDDSADFRIDTPSATVYLLDDGDFRIEVTPSGRTSVVSRRGVAEVVAVGASVLVRGGTQTEVLPSARPAEPRPFNTFVADSFDRWADERDAQYRQYESASGYDSTAYEAVPDEVRPYYRELNHYGDWSYVDDYGYVWRPSRVRVGWRPYYDGYWSYGPHGYFWVSHEPWGWAPYRYGRWCWVGGGWGWVPGRVYAGAWVAWSWGSLHVGWAPLDYWNRPVYYSSYYHGYYDPHCWTFVGYRHLHHRRYHRYAVDVHRVDDIRHHTVVTRAPRVSPRRLADSDTWRNRAVREARESGATARRIDRSRPGSSMRDTDRRLARNRGDASAGVAPARGRERLRTTNGREGIGRRPTATAGRSGPGRDAVGSRGRGSDAPSRRAGASSPDARSRRGDRPQAGRSTGTDSRVRDLYRRMASPRTTRERSPAAGSTSGERGRANAGRDRGTVRKNDAGERARRPSAGTNRSGASATRDRARGSSPGSRARSSNPAPRPKAGASRSGSRSSTPSRARSQSGTSRSKPSVSRGSSRSSTPSRARAKSGTSRSKPSVSRGSSRSSTPSRARAKSGTSRSKPSMSRGSSRSSTPSRARAKSGTSRSKASGSRGSSRGRKK